ncbi:hypothetical protein [Bombiscardovia apis]|nr:hypothetical protein [Bombiscardovia apis]
MDDSVQLYGSMSQKVALQLTVCGAALAGGVLLWCFMTTWRFVGIAIAVIGGVCEYFIVMHNPKNTTNPGNIRRAYGFNPSEVEFVRNNQNFVSEAIKFARPGEYQIRITNTETGDPRLLTAVVGLDHAMRLYEGDTPSDLNIIMPASSRNS